MSESIQRAPNKYFDKAHAVGFNRAFNIVARLLVWRDSSAEYYYPVARQQSRDETDTDLTYNSPQNVRQAVGKLRFVEHQSPTAATAAADNARSSYLSASLPNHLSFFPRAATFPTIAITGASSVKPASLNSIKSSSDPEYTS